MPRKNHVALPSLVRLSAQRYKLITLIMVQTFNQSGFPEKGDFLWWFTRVSLCQQADMILEEYKIPHRTSCISRNEPYFENFSRYRLPRLSSLVDSFDYFTDAGTWRILMNILKTPSWSFALLVKQRLTIHFLILIRIYLVFNCHCRGILEDRRLKSCLSGLSLSCI